MVIQYLIIALANARMDITQQLVQHQSDYVFLIAKVIILFLLEII